MSSFKFQDILKETILRVLKQDIKPIPFKVLLHKVSRSIRSKNIVEFLQEKDFSLALEGLMSKYLVGKNEYGKYYIDYLDYEEKDKFGEGYLDIDEKTGNGYITVKEHINQYKKSAYFVHKKNLNGGKKGDYVKFCELKITDKKLFTKYPLIDASVKEILNKSK